MFYWFVKGIFHPYVALYLGLTRDGLEHLPRRGPAIVVCNHASYMDAIILGSAAPRPIHFIVLQWMYDLIYIRWFYWGMGAIPVRAGSDARGLRKAARVLGRGRLVGIFPEGTRLTGGARLYRRGARLDAGRLDAAAAGTHPRALRPGAAIPGGPWRARPRGAS
jgi:1-acyl-sn-glycerol-3-phosphate acyltransferase